MTKDIYITEDFWRVLHRYMQSGLDYYSNIYKKEAVELSIGAAKRDMEKMQGKFIA